MAEAYSLPEGQRAILAQMKNKIPGYFASAGILSGIGVKFGSIR